ncbi:MAG: hypothetical protein EPO27_07645 [Betaproteobacteria bacterium]|nr:MAG: hypothetical protein EPO27_07645 [Betaproteobacteria bacterium]
MSKLLSIVVAAMFAAVSVNALAAKHMAAEKGAAAEKKEMKTEKKAAAAAKKEMKTEKKAAAAAKKEMKTEKKDDKKAAKK